MKKILAHQKKIIGIFFLQLIALTPMAQVKYHAKDNIQSAISGTSTLHDWTMKATVGECNATFTVNASDQLTGLTTLSYSMPAAALKSEHMAMDKNAYKALKTEQYPNIAFVVTAASPVQNGQVKCLGKLTIGGNTIDAELIATAKVNPDKSIGISGTKKISMKDFNIIPPTFMLGAVKTGNDIILKFDLLLIKL